MNENWLRTSHFEGNKHQGRFKKKKSYECLHFVYTAISGGIGGSPDFLFKSLESKIQLNVSFFQVNDLQPTLWEQRAGHGANAFNEMVCWVWT